MAGMERRRKSVFAESYEPGEDDEAVEKVIQASLILSCTEGEKSFVAQVVHPKSDEQRKRLAAAVSKSFLFRNLDMEQYEEVLDAIFERQVCVFACGTILKVAYWRATFWDCQIQ